MSEVKCRVLALSRLEVIEFFPCERTGIESSYLADIRNVTLVLQEIIEERQLEMLAIIDTGLAAKVRRAQPVAVGSHPAAMKPRPHDDCARILGIVLFNGVVNVN